MKIVWDNCLVPDSATNSASSLDKLVSSFTKDIWRSTADTEILFDCTGANALYIETNALEGYVEVHGKQYPLNLAFFGRPTGSTYVEFPLSTSVKVFLSGEVEVGLVWGGIARDYGETMYPISDTPTDLSFVKKSINGTIISNKGEIKEEMSFNVMADMEQFNRCYYAFKKFGSKKVFLFHEGIYSFGRISAPQFKSEMAYQVSYGIKITKG